MIFSVSIKLETILSVVVSQLIYVSINFKMDNLMESFTIKLVIQAITELNLIQKSLLSIIDHISKSGSLETH